MEGASMHEWTRYRWLALLHVNILLRYQARADDGIHPACPHWSVESLHTNHTIYSGSHLAVTKLRKAANTRRSA